MTYVLFVFRVESDDDIDVATLVVVTEAWVESRLAEDSRYQRLGSGSIAQIIDLGEKAGFERIAVVDAVAYSEDLESERDLVNAQDAFDLAHKHLAQ